MKQDVLEPWDSPRHMTPYLPADDEAWQAMCTNVVMESARLQEGMHPHLRAALAPLLELMNCY